MPFLQVKIFFFFLYQNWWTKSFNLSGSFSKSESKSKDCREIGKVCLDSFGSTKLEISKIQLDSQGSWQKPYSPWNTLLV